MATAVRDSERSAVGQGEAVYHQFLVSRDLGGAGLVALHLADFLGRRGRQCRTWVPGPGAAMDQAGRLGLTVDVYDLQRVLSHSRWKSGLANWKIGRALRRRGPGIVHVHGPMFYGAMSRGLRRSGLKRVVHVHIEEGEGGGLRWALQRPPELIITCARFLVEHVRRALPEPCRETQRIEAVPNAVDTERFRPGDRQEAKRRVGAPVGVPLLLMLANLAPHKGQETAVRAVALLKERGIDTVCWLAGVERGGQQTYTARLRDLIQELGVADRVQLLGQRSDTPDLLRAADLFLLPSTHEGLPLSLLEAQATKVPVLAAPTAGVPEAVSDGRTGFLIAAQDAAGYANRVADLLDNTDLYHRIAEQAFLTTTREYNWHSLCSRVNELYDKLLAQETRVPE